VLDGGGSLCHPREPLMAQTAHEVAKKQVRKIDVAGRLNLHKEAKRSLVRLACPLWVLVA
jgi:hypothetical protein